MILYLLIAALLGACTYKEPPLYLRKSTIYTCTHEQTEELDNFVGGCLEGPYRAEPLLDASLMETCVTIGQRLFCNETDVIFYRVFIDGKFLKSEYKLCANASGQLEKDTCEEERY